MTNVLSQEEIDTLLGGLSAGAVAAGGQASSQAQINAASYDFVQEDRIVRGGLPALEVINDRMARQLRPAFTQLVRRPVDVQVLGQTEMKYGEFIRGLAMPSSLHPLHMEPLTGSALLVLPGKLIFTLMDIIFGGRGAQPEENESREFTLIEQRFINNLTQILDREYSQAWTPVKALKVKSGTSEINPRFLNVAQSSDGAIVVDFEIRIDETKFSLSYCLPHPTLEPIKDDLKGSGAARKGDVKSAWRTAMGRQMEEARVQVRATLGGAAISIRDLLQLKSDDIIQLREDYEHPVCIEVEGVPKFWGVVGSHKCSRAVQVTGILEQEREAHHG